MPQPHSITASLCTRAGGATEIGAPCSPSRATLGTQSTCLKPGTSVGCLSPGESTTTAGAEGHREGRESRQALPEVHDLQKLPMGGRGECSPGYPRGEAVGSKEGKDMLRTELTCTRSAAPCLEEGSGRVAACWGWDSPVPWVAENGQHEKPRGSIGGEWREGGRGGGGQLWGWPGGRGLRGLAATGGEGRKGEGRKGPLGAAGKRRGGKRWLREVKI